MLDTLTRRLSDYLIYVVEDYTSVDQRAVHRHSRALQESARTFKDLIVVHNLRTITDEQALWHQWRQQVTDMYGEGEEVQVGVAVPGSHPNSPMRMVSMSWFRTHSVRVRVRVRVRARARVRLGVEARVADAARALQG